ncbi:hypothetical protein WJX72_011315 [[Myrmecia] bisecta]|uniref:Ferredoxin n=1 Tax=[Myrmecia] bisecta TaxID=41462 RepID=A0AAW1QSP5_9CHLO
MHSAFSGLSDSRVCSGHSCSTSCRTRQVVRCSANNGRSSEQGGKGKFGLGDLLGPIGLTLGGKLAAKETGKGKAEENSVVKDVADAAGVSLGPISLSFGDDFGSSGSNGNGAHHNVDGAQEHVKDASISSLSTEEWRKRYEQDGYVDLWVEEEFNSGSRLVGGRDAHKGKLAGFGSGEGPSAGAAPRHKVKIYNHHASQEMEVEVPEDRYILWEAEEQGLLLPWACRMGCCTACAVKVKSGQMSQPQALGVSQELRERGYALMCVGYPLSDLVLETVEEDEVYDLQFGKAFAEQATSPISTSVMRDDFALELADMDE